MSITSNSGLKNDQNQQKLLLWPGVLIVALQWLFRFGFPAALPGIAEIGVLGGLFFGLVLIVWWAFFSKASRLDRWGAVVIMILALLLAFFVVHDSIQTGMMGMMYATYALPVVCLAFVIWAVFSRKLSLKLQRVTMIATIVFASGLMSLLKCDGITGYGGANFSWRWAETPEERLLAQNEKESMKLPLLTEAGENIAEWPGFRGAERDGIVHNVRIETDWSNRPPVEVWRRPIGPGCSSCSVRGDLLYTQEQRGEDEVVACYNLDNGKLVWQHQDAARFYDSHAGAGPRSTPTLSGERVYTLGATGILNVLDGTDGSTVWSRNAATDTEAEIAAWGVTSSPLVVEDVVVVAVAGAIIAYDLANGDIRWVGTDGGSGYSSPHLLTIDAIPQILFMSEFGAVSFSPADGKQLWEHPWPQVDRILQPAMTEDGDVLLPTGGEEGIRRITVRNSPDGWTQEEQWTSTQLKSYFNDIVVHKGHAYGFTGPSLACMDLEDGQRKWRGGRYGGQIILLAEQDLLLVLTEKGEVALVEAVPEGYNELAKIPAIEGKTWNHPILVDDLLIVRNTQEMVAFRLSLAGS